MPTIYPGSFDPITNGHVDLIRRAARVFDNVIVAIATNVRKNELFSVQERMDMIREVTVDIPGVEVDSFGGLLVDYMNKMGSTTVIRGLRAVSDFEYEFQMAHMNRQLSKDIETIFLVTGTGQFYISSSVVKEVALFGGCVDGLVPAVVKERLLHKIESMRCGQ